MKKGKYPQMRIDNRLYGIVEMYSEKNKRPMSKVMTDIYNEHQQMLCVLTEIIQGHQPNICVGIMEKVGKKTLITGPLILEPDERVVLAYENTVKKNTSRPAVEPKPPYKSTETKAPEASQPQEPDSKTPASFTYRHSDGNDYRVFIIKGTARIPVSLLRKVVNYTPEQRLSMKKEILRQYQEKSEIFTYKTIEGYTYEIRVIDGIFQYPIDLLNKIYGLSQSENLALRMDIQKQYSKFKEAKS